MLRCMLGLMACLAMIGCSKGSAVSGKAEAATKSGPPADPDKALYDQVRSGTYQIGAAIDAIEEVRKTARSIAARETGNTHQALLTISGQLNDAGKTLSDFSDDPPSFEEFKQNFGVQDEKRLKTIDACNESLDDLFDAEDILTDLLNSHPPEPENGQLVHAESDLEGCIQTTKDAIQALGGKVTASDNDAGT